MEMGMFPLRNYMDFLFSSQIFGVNCSINMEFLLIDWSYLLIDWSYFLIDWSYSLIDFVKFIPN